MNNINLIQFLFKNVNVTLKSGEKYTGIVVGHWTAEEDEGEEGEKGEEGIGISESRYSHDGIGILKKDIKSIELAP